MTLFFCPTKALSQTTSTGCPPSTAGWTRLNPRISTPLEDLIDGAVPIGSGSVTGLQNTIISNNGNVRVEIFIDWTSLVNFTMYSDETLKELLIFKAIDEANITNGEVAIQFESMCVALLHCELELDYSNYIVCTEVPGVDASYTRNEHRYINKYYYRKCGTKCCEKVYTIVNSNITSITNQAYNNSECNCTATYYRCNESGGTALPCTSDCQK